MLRSLKKLLCGKKASHPARRPRQSYRPVLEKLEDRLMPSTIARPPAPTFTATAVSDTQIDLSWHRVARASGYLIDEQVNGGWMQIASVSSRKSSFWVTGLSPGTTYSFKLAAFNTGATNWAKHVESATTFQAPPIAPSFTTTAASGTEIDLSWSGVSGASGYLIDQWINGAWTQIASVGSGSTGYAVTGLNPNTTYSFDLAAFNTSGTTWAASYQSATTKPATLTNTLWSGYAIVPGSPVNAVGGSWVQPAVSSTGANSVTSFWLGIDGYNGRTVEQIGTTWSPSSGYTAWVEFYGDGVQNATGKYFYATSLNSIIGYNFFNIRPGDTISARVQYLSSTSTTSTFEFQFEDTPQGGQTKSWQEPLTTQYVVPARSTGEWIVESPNFASAPLANFGTASFSGVWASAGGTTGPINAFTNYAINLVPSGNGGGTDFTSGLVDSNTPGPWEYTGASSSFTVTFGGATIQAVTATNADGRTVILAVAVDHSFWVGTQTTSGSSVYNWVDMGGWIKNLQVGRNADGRLEAFGIGSDGAIYYTFQVAPSGAWSGWQGMGGWVSQIALGQNADGRLEVFGIGSNGALYANCQQSPGGAWGGYQYLGGWVSQIAVAQSNDGRLEVFGIGSDHAVYRILQTSRNGSLSGWQRLPNGGWVSAIEVLQTGNGLELLGLGSDGVLYESLESQGFSSWFPASS